MNIHVNFVFIKTEPVTKMTNNLSICKSCKTNCQGVLNLCILHRNEGKKTNHFDPGTPKTEKLMAGHYHVCFKYT